MVPASLKPFWGLVVQKGPWKSTASDLARAREKDQPSVGGGIPFGGRAHAGNAGFKSVMTPYQIDATGSPLEPSTFATAPYMKRQGTRGGVVKTGLTLGARTPNQTGHKMGTAPSEMRPASPGPAMDTQMNAQTASLMPEHHMEEYLPSLMGGSEEGGENGSENVASYGTQYSTPVEQYPTTYEYTAPVYDQITQTMAASTNPMDEIRKQVMRQRAQGVVRRELQRARASQYLEGARANLQGPPTSSNSFRYKKSYTPTLKPIKEVRSLREQGGPKPIRRTRPDLENMIDPDLSFYDSPQSRVPMKRTLKGKKVNSLYDVFRVRRPPSARTEPKNKRVKLAPLEKIPKRGVQIKLRIGERSEKKRSMDAGTRTDKNRGKKLKMAPFEK